MAAEYDLDQIRFGTDRPTFERAVGLYEGGKVTAFRKAPGGYEAVVLGSHSYRVSVSDQKFDNGNCDCYLGQKDVLCKHLAATAIMAVMDGRPLSDDDKRDVSRPSASGRRGRLDAGQLAETKGAVIVAMRYIKPYNGPSRLWFAYQDSLSQGCSRLAVIVSGLPVSAQTAGLVVNVLLRLDRKLCESGVDDSDGTVGGFMMDIVEVLKEYVALDPECTATFKAILERKTCFEWEEPSIRLLDERGSDGTK